MNLEKGKVKTLSEFTMKEQLDYYSSGTFGCTFKKRTENNKKTRTIIKIQKYDDSAMREENIGKRIRKIPKYQLYFAPILRTSLITIGEVDDEEIRKCEIITNEQSHDRKYITNTMKYVGKYTLGEYVIHVFETRPKLFLRTFIGAYFDTLYDVNLLLQNGINHFDLKENNIIFDLNHKRPILIDFGQSIDESLLNRSAWSDYFFTYGYDYPPWCFEIGVIGFGVNELGADLEKEIVTAEQVEKLCNNFTGSNPLFARVTPENDHHHGDIYTEDEVAAYNKKLKDFLTPFIGTTWSALIENLIHHKSTWDIYATHVIFLSLMFHVHIYEYNTATFPSIQNFIGKLKREVMALPTERKSYTDISQELMSDFGQTDRTEAEFLTMTISKASADEQQIVEVKKRLNRMKLRELKREKQFYPSTVA